MVEKSNGPTSRSMPEFKKPPPALVEQFRAAVADVPGAQPRQMFGSPAAFASGQMFTGLFGPNWFLRLADPDRAELEGLGGAPFEVMPGRPMKGYMLVPSGVRDDPPTMRRWLQRSFDYATSLPPKERRASR